MGVLGRRGATCIFNPYHPTPEAVEAGYGNGITFGFSNGIDESLLKWGQTQDPQTNKYPIYSWWVGDNEGSGKTDGAWFPQGPANRVSKKKGDGYLFLTFGLEVTGYGHIYGGYYNLYGKNKIGEGSDGRIYYFGSHIPYTKTGGLVNSPKNPPFPAGTEFISTRSAQYTSLRFRPSDPTSPFSYWTEITQSLAVDGAITTESQEDVIHPYEWDPIPEGWKLWWEENGKKHYWKETGGDIDSEYFNENFWIYSTPVRYPDPGISPRDDEADNYPEYDISSTELTDDESTQYGIFESENSTNIYNTYKFLSWNTPVSDYCWRKDYKTMNFKLVVKRNSQDCDTGCSYAGKKFNFKLTYQEGDMAIALNGSNSYSGTPFFATKSTITWGAIKTESITVDPLKLSDWTSGPVINQKEVWTKNWSAEEIGRGKARRLIDFYLESIE